MSGTAQIIDRLKDLNIAIASHIFVTGPCHELEEFLKGKAKAVAFVGLPFSYSKIPNAFLNFHENGRPKLTFKGPATRSANPFYLKDILFIFYAIFKTGKVFDIFIGINNLNAFCGLLLKKLGRVKKVIFYTIDYIPQRFKNPILNRIYHWVDKYCCYHCDCVWNLSAVMAEERDKRGVLKARAARQVVVPIGNNFESIKRLTVKEINRHAIVYMGHLREKQGVELALEALPEVIAKVPQARLVIIGTGHLEESLKMRAKELAVESRVEFKGFIPDIAAVEAMLAKCAVAVAPYVVDAQSFTQYTDPGKPKTYLAAGLPVVMTRVSQAAIEIEKAGAGIIINYDKKELAGAIVKLFSDDEAYQRYRDNAINFARGFSWEKIFTGAFEKTLDK